MSGGCVVVTSPAFKTALLFPFYQESMMYDLAVIGNDLSSQVAALAAAKRGMNTVLIREGGHPCLYSQQGYVFPLDPFPPLGFGSGQTIDRFLSLTGIKLPQSNRPESSIKPLLQVILPDNRLDIAADGEQLVQEICRAFPNLGNRRIIFKRAVAEANKRIDCLVERFFNFPYAPQRNFAAFSQDLISTLRWWIYSPSYLNLMRKEQSVGTLLRSLGIVSSYRHIRSVFDPAFAYAMALPLRLCPPGSQGRGVFFQYLKNNYRNTGKIFENHTVIRIKLLNNISLELADGDLVEVVKAKRLIVSAGWEKLNLILGRDFKESHAKLLSAIRPRLFPFTIHLGIKERAIPEKMANYVIFLNGDKKSSAVDDMIFLETGDRGEEAFAPDNRKALTVTILTGTPPWRMRADDLKTVAAQALSSLQSFLPFLQENIDFLEVDHSIAIARKYQEMLNHRHEAKRSWSVGFGVHSHQTIHPQVFFTGAMLWAGLGYEGEVLSGLAALEMALRKEN